MRANQRRRFVMILTALFALFGLFTASAVARPGLGTADTPVMLSIDTGIDADAVEQMAVALEIATGLHFEVESVEYGRPGVDWLCDEFPDRGLRIMQATEYIVAKEDCAAHTSMTLNRWGRDRHRGQFLVPYDSGLSSLADLAGLDWSYPDEGSVSGYLAPLQMLIEAGVEGYTPINVGSHTAAVEAVYDNAVDPGNPDPVFATVYEDARIAFDNTYPYGDFDPSVFDVVDVLEVSPYMLFEAAAFGPKFPGELRNQIEDLLQGFSYADHPAHWVWEESVGDAYNSDGWIKVNWKDYHFLRDAMASAGFEF